MMNQDILRGKWNQFKGDIKRQWGQLTDDDLTRIEGDYDKFVGVLQERYGYERERARQELDAYLNQTRSTV
jgi:uncharacterized protein YjbJ (UPF0337 family)